MIELHARIEQEFLADTVEDDDGVVDRIADNHEDGRKHGRSELAAADVEEFAEGNEEADGHQHVVDGRHHCANAEADFKAEGNVKQYPDQCQGHRYERIQLNGLADGRADLREALRLEARLGVGLLQRRKDGAPLIQLGLQLEVALAGADVGLVNRIDLAQPLIADKVLDFARGNWLLCRDGDLIATGEVDAPNLIPVQPGGEHADQHDQPGGGESRAAELHEVDALNAQSLEPQHLLEQVVFEHDLEERPRNDERREHRGADTNGQCEAEALDRPGAKPDQDDRREQGGHVGVDDG